MPLWGRNEGSGSDDVALLRQSVIFLLARLAELGPPEAVEDLRRVAERVSKPPVPTGLLRELQKVVVTTPRARATSAALPELAASAAKALGHAMTVVALLDHELEEAVKATRDAIPPRMGTVEATRVEKMAFALMEKAGPARERALRRKEEVAALIVALGAELASLTEQGAAVAHDAKQMVALVESDAGPEDLRSFRETLVSQVRALGVSTGNLQGALMEAKARSAQLEERLLRKEEELLDLRSAASLDVLTGLLNRGAFNKALLDDMKRAEALKLPFVLLMLDIDHFKSVNDTWGHPVGDKVIEGVAFVLKHQVRGSDRAARYGGEEFAVILSGANMGIAQSVAERIRQGVSAMQFDVPTGFMGVTISVGVASLGPGEGPASLVSRADKALYAAKHGGRDQVCVAIPAADGEAKKH